MSCITCGTWTDMDVAAGRAGTTRPRWPEGSLASRPRDGFNSQLDGDESAKRILGGVGHQPPAAGPGSGGYPHSMS